MRHTTFAIAALLALITLAERPVAAKVGMITLEELTDGAEFIGIVRVESVGFGIRYLFQGHATATVLERWKGQARRWIRFGSTSTWSCDISDAHTGEEALVFTEGRQLAHAGRGRMPIFTRDGRRLAAVGPEVRLPATLVVEGGPKPDSDFIRAVSVDDLRTVIRK